MTNNDEKHVMLSYNHSSKDLVKRIHEILKQENIKTWFDERDMDGDLYDG